MANLSLRPFHRFRPADGVRWLLTGWLLAVFVEYMLLPEALQDLSGLQGLAQMSLPRLLTVTALAAFVVAGCSLYLPPNPARRWAIPLLFFALAVQAMRTSYNPAFLTVCILVLLILAVYALRGWNRRPVALYTPQPVHPAWYWITGGLALIFFLFVSAWTVGRVATLGVSTYDFGLFAQMFHSMKETGLPMTTLERDGLLSHFAVHVSPIYYLMLPFYCLVPEPATLQVLQAAVMASAVIPLWKLCSRFGLNGLQRTLLCAALLLYPAYAGGASYDLHENCFLTPLILWLLYGIEAKSIPLTALSTLLTLMVKEDAAVYVAVIGLWLLVRTALRHKALDRQDLITGGALLGLSLVWFFLVTGYLAQSGDGVMTYRYNNFIYDGSSSLLTVIKAVLLNPMKAVYECVDPEKLEYIAITLLPLLGLPLVTRRYERYILLIPYVLVNLMSDYPYQHNYFFQYSFGSIAFLMYLTAVNLADFKDTGLRFVPLVLSVLICGSCFNQAIYGIATYYPRMALANRDQYQEILDMLDRIPDDASVTASGYYTTPLSDREILYDLRYTTRQHLLESEYVAIQVRDTGGYEKFATNGENNGLENLISILERSGFEHFAEIEGTLLIYRKVPAAS